MEPEIVDALLSSVTDEEVLTGTSSDPTEVETGKAVEAAATAAEAAEEVAGAAVGGAAETPSADAAAAAAAEEVAGAAVAGAAETPSAEAAAAAAAEAVAAAAAVEQEAMEGEAGAVVEKTGLQLKLQGKVSKRGQKEKEKRGQKEKGKLNIVSSRVLRTGASKQQRIEETKNGERAKSKPKGRPPTTRSKAAVQPTLFRWFCSFTRYGRELAQIPFTEGHRRLMHQTVFRGLMDVPRMNFDRFTVEDVLATHVEEDIFLIGPHRLRFSAKDVALITGLPDCGDTIDLFGSPVKKSHLSERFGDVRSWDLSTVVRMIMSIVTSTTTEDVEDTVRLWIVLILCCFLAPLSGQACPRWFLHCLDDLSRINNYAWALAVRAVVMKNLEKAAIII